MQTITLHKQPSESYSKGRFKTYNAKRGGEVVGTVGQDLWGKWSVLTADYTFVSRHTTIKAAVRVASRALC